MLGLRDHGLGVLAVGRAELDDLAAEVHASAEKKVVGGGGNSFDFMVGFLVLYYVFYSDVFIFEGVYDVVITFANCERIAFRDIIFVIRDP